MIRPVLIVLVLLSSCFRFPETDMSAARDTSLGFPELVPLESLLASARGGKAAETISPVMIARINRLRGRADRLRQRTAITATDRADLSERVRVLRQNL